MKSTTFLRRLFKAQPLMISVLIGTGALVGLLEGSGIALLVPLIQMIGSQAQSGAGIGRLGQAIQGLLAFFSIPFSLGPILALLFLIVLATQALMFAQTRLMFRMQFKFEAEQRRKLYQVIFAADWAFFLKKKLGDLTNTITTEVVRASQAFSQLFMMIAAGLVIAAYLGLAFLMSWQMTMMVIVIGGLGIALLQKRINKAKKQGQDITEANADMQSEVVEQLGGAKLIKGCAVEETTIARFNRYIDEVAKSHFINAVNRSLLKFFYEPLVVGLLCVGIYFALTYLKISIAKLIVFLFIFYRLSPRLSNLQSFRHNILTHLPAIDRIDQLHAEAVAHREQGGAKIFKRMFKGLTFKDVDFSYQAGHPVIKHLSFEISKGKTVAIVGSSGAGKSTIVDLIMGLVVSDSGEVLVDNVPLIEHDLSTWRRRIGYVAQDTVLFHASVRDNIAWTNPEATDDKVRAAADAANALDFVEQLPQGFDTIVGDRGARLSGGQKQRLALARALVRDPEVLMLDEATSALDAESEKKIQEAIEVLAESTMTIIIITHRLATVKNADVIYVLEEGELVEEGDWQTLVKGKGRFRTLKHLQALD